MKKNCPWASDLLEKHSKSAITYKHVQRTKGTMSKELKYENDIHQIENTNKEIIKKNQIEILTLIPRNMLEVFIPPMNSSFLSYSVEDFWLACCLP